MRRLLPPPVIDVDLYEALRPPASPFVRLDMVMSADGAVTDRRGRAGGLGGEGDRAVFRTLRAHADAVLVGAGTVRVEHYGPHRPDDELAARRRADGRADPAAVVVVSRSLQLDANSRLFTEARTPTVVLTCGSSDPERRAALESVARVVVVGDERVDLAQGLAVLRERFGFAQIVCEGGPSLNGGMLSAGLIDELCLTLGPTIVGGGGPRLVEGLDSPRPLRLDAVLEHAAELFLRYGFDDRPDDGGAEAGG